MEKPAITERPIHEILKRRWSPRAFADKPVAAETLGALLEAARWAASSYNEQPWRFLVATKDDAKEFQHMLDCLVPLNQAWAKGAPVLILNVVKHNFSHNDTPNRVAIYDCGAAAAQLTAEATARGLFVHQMAGIDQNKCRETYKIPQGFEAVAAIALGYGADPAALSAEMREAEMKPRTRKALKEIAFTGSFGTPAKAL